MFDYFFENKDTIESAAKVKLEWDKLDNKKASAIYTYIPKLSFNDQSNYPDLMNKAIDLVIAIREAFSPFVNQYSGDLLSMGYRTIVSPHGGDSGIDITAYKDELPPRILVQVKSQDSDIKETTIQSLKGAMREGDYGLFVTLSNYTKKHRNILKTHL